MTGAKIANSTVTLGKLAGGGTAGVLVTTSGGVISAGAMTTDANGWVVRNYGTHRVFSKRYGPFSSTNTPASGTVTVASSQTFPVGVAPTNFKSFTAYAVNSGGNTGQLAAGIGQWNVPTASTAATHDVTLRNLTTAVLSWADIYVYVEIVV